MIQNKLQALAEKKKVLGAEHQTIVQLEADSGLIATSKKTIQANALAVKKSWKRAAPYLQKRLLGTLFHRLIATEKGLKIFYALDNDAASIGNENKEKRPSGEIPGGRFFFNWLSNTLKVQILPVGYVGGR